MNNWALIFFKGFLKDERREFSELTCFSFAALYKIVKDVGPSPACISVFAGLEGTKDELQLPASNTWAMLR